MNDLTHEQLDLIARWADAQRKVEELKLALVPLVEEERLLRGQVVMATLPDEVEGTTTMDLPNNWALKVALSLDRKVDEAALPATREVLAGMGVNADRLVRWKPEVQVKEYRTLTAEQRAAFDKALLIKPKTPDLTLLPPKET